jgi:hypothetical protein
MSLLKSRTTKKFSQPAGFGIMGDLLDKEKVKADLEKKLKEASKRPSDDIPPKVGSAARNDSRQNWLQRSKEEGEELQEKKDQEEQEAAEAAAAEEQAAIDKERGFSDDYFEGMTKGEARKEHNQNKKGIRQKKKEEKKELKGNTKWLSKERRQGKRDIRQKKKDSKRESKCGKFEAQGKTSKKWYTNNC